MDGQIAMKLMGVTALALPMLLTVPAYGTQVVPIGVEYTNDSIEQGGKVQVCIVAAAIINPPAPEIVNFQFMHFVNGRVAFKVTAGDMNWTNASLVAKRISEANFFTGAFNHPNAFDKRSPPRGSWWRSLQNRA